MTEAATVRFTLAQKVRGLLVAGVVAWLVSLAAMYASAHIFDFIERETSGPMASFLQRDNAVGWTLMGAVYLGLPVAFVTVLAFGFPLMSHAEKTGATSFSNAAMAGLICGAIIGAVMALLAVLIQRPDQAAPTRQLLEWIKLAVDAAVTPLIGMLTGISARLATGRPKLA